MNQPSVVAIMLTANRPEMARQAVESFRRQTYANKRLLILDTGQREDAYTYIGSGGNQSNERLLWNPLAAERTIGDLRNSAGQAAEDADILIHFDDDDLSHPNRIAEQVQLLQSSGADAVGYNECLFWREPLTHKGTVSGCEGCGSTPCICAGEAWLYTSTNPNEAIGSSLCYWRKTWERKPFQTTSQGEDAAFQIGLKVAAVSALPLTQLARPLKSEEFTFTSTPKAGRGEILIGVDTAETFRNFQDTMISPRLLCRIHSGNTSNAYTAENMRAAEWQRVPEWDDYCRAEFSR